MQQPLDRLVPFRPDDLVAKELGQQILRILLQRMILQKPA